jgi:hypothetical protein
MTIDTSAWIINDPEWKRNREEQWPVFERWFIKNNSCERSDVFKMRLINAKKYYDEGFLDEKIECSDDDWRPLVGFRNTLPLHANLTPQAFRQLLNYPGFRHYGLKGSFGAYYLTRGNHLDLINAGVLQESFILAILEGAYGHSLNEAAEILGFEVKSKCYEVVHSVGPLLYAYYFSDDQDKLTYETANFMLPLYLEALEKITDKEAEDCDFIFAQHVKRKKKYYDGNLVDVPERVEFMKRLLKGIEDRWNGITPVAREKLKGLFE